ncbi:hypothetical protein HZS_2459, partial [Henneguya salminicola]
NVLNTIEVNNFQRKLFEYYKQMTSIHDEMEQYYLLLADLEDIFTMMQKIVFFVKIYSKNNLLESVIITFPSAASSPSGQLQFVNNLKLVLKSTKESYIKSKIKLDKSLEEYNFALKKHQDIVSKQNKYEKLIQKFRIKLS